MAQVDLTLAARLDLQEIWDYIARDSQFQADRLIERFALKFDHLAQHTGLGRPRPELADACKSYPFGKYCFYFRVTEAGILVLRVLHSARDIERIQLPE
jgi:toxin ParE1/3/4